MDQEGFVETLIRQCTNDVREVLVECEHRGQLDFEAFHKKIQQTWKAARHGGLSPDQFRSVLEDVVPAYVDRIELT